MKSTDTPPCPDCGGQLTEHGPDNDSSRNAYDCTSCGWGLQDCDEPLTLATAPWTREVWAHAARLDRLLAVERGDAGAASEGWRDESAPLARRCSWVRRVFRETGGLEWLLQVWWDGAWKWETNGLPAPRLQGAAPTALEAMEAADRAAKGET